MGHMAQRRHWRRVFFFSSRRRHTRSDRDWSSDVCSSDLRAGVLFPAVASDRLAQKIAATAGNKTPARSRITFRALANEWQGSVLPMYKHSTQRHRRFMLRKHLLPRFGDTAVSDVTRQEIQGYVAHLLQHGYAPKSIDHIHDVLSAVLHAAVKWGHLQENPASGVDLPKLRTVRPKWVLTAQQAAPLLAGLRPLPAEMVGLGVSSGLR